MPHADCQRGNPTCAYSGTTVQLYAGCPPAERSQENQRYLRRQVTLLETVLTWKQDPAVVRNLAVFYCIVLRSCRLFIVGTLSMIDLTPVGRFRGYSSLRLFHSVSGKNIKPF